ncbi:hypothetical protein DPMN_040031 [Dreissena polymorpha]|uniref:Uncharacterized protein n=1 Tax=Dreissena polymorpha TaxID=45954 RepID=A0A9D4HSN8_DREPO|nr:hypothetical protein DPMN_040031 [Dreissena polymorpha]
MLKLAQTDQPTDQQTNQQTGQKQYVPHYYNIIWTNRLTKFHEDRKINVAFGVLTRKNAPQENCPTPWRPCFFLPIQTIFELNRHIQKTHVLTIVHEDWTKIVTDRVFTCFHYIHIEKTAPPPGGHKTHVLTIVHEDWTKIVTDRVFTCFHYIHIEKTASPPDINETNVLTKFHDDWVKIVTSRVFTRNTAPPPGSHVFQWTGTIFELNQHII